MEEKLETEQKIFEAARHVFHQRGYDGARMQEIADQAGINKALLHYYYRSKDKLYEAVFKEALKRVGPKMFEGLDSDIDLEEKLRKFTSNYINTLKRNPFIPGFIIHEVHSNKERFKDFLAENVKGIVKLDKINAQLEEGIQEGKYREISAEQLFMNVFSLCAFPFAARPAFQTLLDLNDDAYMNLLEERKTLIPELILKSLKK